MGRLFLLVIAFVRRHYFFVRLQSRYSLQACAAHKRHPHKQGFPLLSGVELQQLKLF